MKTARCMFGVALLLGAIQSTTALAQPAISWFTIDAGGGHVTGANGYALEGTIGQFDVGVSTNGPIQGQWGYWPGVLTTCSADFNHDTFTNSQDFFDFLAAFFGMLSNADFNHDTFINSQDFFDFLAAFFAGC